jgi:TetR/AcrR family transcriptional repressor of nem operon
MPWPQDHKSRTRERIVQAAAAAFRVGGISGVRVEDVMARAGLTHGGFYAHFASKDDLLRESLDYASRQTVENLSKPLAGVQSEDRFRAVIDAYLSPAHVTHPELGCPLASLGPEVARAGGTTQRTLAEGVKGRIAWMRQLLPESQRDGIPENQVISTLACMIGGVILARAVPGSDSAVVLNACREFLQRTFEESAEGAAVPPTKTHRKRATTARASRGSTAQSSVRRTEA